MSQIKTVCLLGGRVQCFSKRSALSKRTRTLGHYHVFYMIAVRECARAVCDLACVAFASNGRDMFLSLRCTLLLLASTSRLLVASKSELRKSRDAQRLAAQQAEREKALLQLGLRPGIEHMAANVTLHGGTLAGASRRLKNVTSSVACYRACEAYQKCVQFTFRHSVQKGPQCFFKVATSQPIAVEKSMSDGVVDIALVSGIIDRSVGATASSVSPSRSAVAVEPSDTPVAAKHSGLAAAARKPHERLRPGFGAPRRMENATRGRQQARERRRKRTEARHETNKQLELSLPANGDRRELLAVFGAFLLVMALVYCSALVCRKK